MIDSAFVKAMSDNVKLLAETAEATGNVIASYKRLAVEISDSSRIQRLFDDSVGKTAVITPGTYDISSPIVLPVGTRLVMHRDAILKAVSAIDVILTTPVDIQHVDGSISGGVLDCNGLAKIGLHLKYFNNFYLENTKVENPKEIMFKFGSKLTAKNSYGIYVYNIVGHRMGGIIAPIGSIGLTFENCSDNKLINPLMIGNKIGFLANSSNNEFINAHAWNYPSNSGMDKAFEVTGISNFFTNCFADTPSIYGFHVKNYNNFFIGCKVFVNNTTLGVDNTIIGVKVEQRGAYSSFVGCLLFGTSSSHRMAKDFDGVLDDVTIIGTQTSNVVITTKNKLQALSPIITDSVTINNSGDGAEVMKINIERAWRMVQKGVGAAAGLFFKPANRNKKIGVLSHDDSYAFEIEANDDASGPSKGKIDGNYIVTIKNGSGNPNGIVTPDFLGQDYIDTFTKIGYKACGTGNTDWKQTTN
ncbi:hypothetical protein ACFQ9Y_05015 [Peribacillus simplex]|uniref:hypothetical protein n=1 Tax=Peribacillus simplex TaxID=1478 RepID=UPI0036713B26